jgi:hypothetical protein
MLIKSQAPNWVPLEVQRIGASIWAHHQDDTRALEILERLISDLRMKKIWTQLLAENRKTGGFLYPVVGDEREQHRATGKVLNLAFCAARDKISACPIEEIEAERMRLQAQADDLRRTADEYAAAASDNPKLHADAMALLRAAQLKEEAIRRWMMDVRDVDDPLTIVRDRSGNLQTRGICSSISAGLREIYGKSLYGISTTLAEIATGDGAISKRMVRSSQLKAAVAK